MAEIDELSVPSPSRRRGTRRAGISVIVPTRDRPQMLHRCLRSLMAALDDGDEVIVVDSASRPSNALAVEHVAQEHGARLVRCELAGASRARNAGFKVARHPLVAYLDDDTWVDGRWADSLVEALSGDPRAVFVTGRIEVPEGQSPRIPVAVKQEEEPAVLDRSSRGTLGHSASMALRRSAMAEVGGFDEQLGAGARFRGGEDADLFDRLLARGHTGRYEPAAVSWHDQWRSLGELVRLDFGYGIGEGAELAKLLRYDRARARSVAVEYGWTWGLADLWNALRARHRFLVLCALARLAGMARGFVSGMAVPLADGHYSSNSQRHA